MSIALPVISLAGAVVGSTGTITLQNVGYTADPSHYNSPATLQIYNDSGAGLMVTTINEGHSLYVPAGGWRAVTLTPGESGVSWVVVYLIPNAPIASLLAIYYAPNEQVDEVGTLGNSPIGGAIQASTSLTSTLSNEGNPSPTLVIDIGDLNFTDLFTLFNDGSCIWYVDQTGVKHLAIRVNNVGTPLQLGQAGDTSEVMGQLKIDQLLSAILGASITGGSIILTGNGAGSLHLGVIAQGDILDTSGASTFLKAPTTVSVQVPSGTTIGSFTSSGLAMGANALSATRVNFAQSGFDHVGAFSGTGSGTFGTGLSVAPSAMFCDPCTVNGSSQTWGATIATSSGVTTGAGLAWQGFASH